MILAGKLFKYLNLNYFSYFWNAASGHDLFVGLK